MAPKSRRKSKSQSPQSRLSTSTSRNVLTAKVCSQIFVYHIWSYNLSSLNWLLICNNGVSAVYLCSISPHPCLDFDPWYCIKLRTVATELQQNNSRRSERTVSMSPIFRHLSGFDTQLWGCFHMKQHQAITQCSSVLLFPSLTRFHPSLAEVCKHTASVEGRPAHSTHHWFLAACCICVGLAAACLPYRSLLLCDESSEDHQMIIWAYFAASTWITSFAFEQVNACLVHPTPCVQSLSFRQES